MQGESDATAGYHSENAAVVHTEEQMAEATIGALANLVLIPQVRQAHKYPISPWEMMHLPVGDDASPCGR
jgi:hypothetical protein